MMFESTNVKSVVVPVNQSSATDKEEQGNPPTLDQSDLDPLTECSPGGRGFRSQCPTSYF